MGALLGQHEKSSIGQTQTLAFSSGASTAGKLLASSGFPRIFDLYTDEDVYLRMGSSSSVAAGVSDFFLAAGSYRRIVVTDARQSYIAAYGVTAAGTLRATEANNNDPGTGTSGAFA